MTACEIKEQIAEGKTQIGWLKEIAYQLAVMNEAKDTPVSPAMGLDPAQLVPLRRGPGRSPKTT